MSLEAEKGRAIKGTHEKRKRRRKVQKVWLQK
jgi:hypothetical protein